jgi:hypothetical protein
MIADRPSDPPPPSTGDGPIAPPPRLGCSGVLGSIALAAAVIGAVVFGLVVGRCSDAGPAPAPATSVTVVKPSPNVVRAIRDLARLEGAEYHMERVVDLKEKQSRFFGLIETEDAILLVAAGDVVAGVDLAELRDGDVVVDGEKNRATITLPQPKVLSARIDNERTYVHTRRTDTLASRKESLETRARQEAERSIVEAAQQAGIIERARQNTKRTIETLVRSLGYNEVTVTFRDTP